MDKNASSTVTALIDTATDISSVERDRMDKVVSRIVTVPAIAAPGVGNVKEREIVVKAAGITVIVSATTASGAGGPVPSVSSLPP